MSLLEHVIVNLKVNTFIVEFKNNFTNTCYRALCKLKDKYHYLKLVYLKFRFGTSTPVFDKYLKENFDEVIFYKELEPSTSLADNHINYLIEHSNVIIMYKPTKVMKENLRKKGKKLICIEN